MIIEHKVMEAFQHYLRMDMREAIIHKNGGEETPEQRDERLESRHQFNTLHLQYLAQFA